ncbi:helix-turn-helix domain-containing protein [Sporosarcina sp. ACRSL]|uniref:helix-turn-helix domain-containing protein n=1 Tax=Sporosarcina sp. ACRSL TaxID=2918215 RepID=UPI001EF3D6BE|nr:helix-turn-helix transcriptional regulator [Sporosarcina sp. ACRSL]MCG7346224.1 helix-turn-helix domain-containing protein [Sporosarcina sp. ACRSL]
MLSTLGERIRAIRKQRKMTLDALAGEQMTKAMMSYIENNKANPSMESLSYIAERLGVKVSELLEDVNPQELRDLLKTVENIFTGESEDKYKQIIDAVDSYKERLDQGYEAARLLELYGRSLYYAKKDGWNEWIDKAANLYEQLNLTSRLAAIGIFQSIVKYTKREYDASLTLLLEERSKIEARNGLIEPITRLDFDYWESLLHFAVGNSEEAVRIMNEGIKFSKEQQIFYRIAHLYQLAIVNAMMNKDVSSIQYYERKILHYGEFADDRDAIPFTNFVKIHYLTTYEKDYVKALRLIQDHHGKHGIDESHTSYSFLQEKGKALYGLGRYEEALACFDKVKIPDYAHHPFDLSILYEKDAYAALCHMTLGNKTEANRSIETAVDNISSMPRTPYKDFIMKTYKMIQRP